MQIKVDVNFVFHGTVLPVTHRPLMPIAQELFTTDITCDGSSASPRYVRRGENARAFRLAILLRRLDMHHRKAQPYLQHPDESSELIGVLHYLIHPRFPAQLDPRVGILSRCHAKADDPAPAGRCEPSELSQTGRKCFGLARRSPGCGGSPARAAHFRVYI